jgi:DNA-binding NarL/FixJ family response regulator
MRVLLVDRQPATRLGLRVLVEGIEGVRLVGEASDGGEALRLSERFRPDLVIVDPDLADGAGVCGALKAAERPPRVLVYSEDNSRESVAAASLAGADGFVHKEVDTEALPEAIKRTCAGDRVWMLGPVEPRGETALRAQIEAAKLTPREKDILDLMLKRRTNPEIANHLHVTVNTVRTHVKSILRELGVGSRRELLDERQAS